MELSLDIFLSYLPHYIYLVLVPAIVRLLVEDWLGVKYYPVIFSIVLDDDKLRFLVYSVVVAPLLEEILFRGLPLYFFGIYGLILGSVAFILLHPLWQVKYVLPEYRLKMFLTSLIYYIPSTVFFCLPWINGEGLVAVVYHMLHNLWVSILTIVYEGRRRSELDVLVVGYGGSGEGYKFVKKYKFVRRRE